MAQQTINIGASPNDGTGTPLRTAFQYTNSNFSELYTAVGPSGNNIVVPGSATITGDLTVRTTGLTTTASAVGINTASPTANTLTIGANRFIICSDSQSKFGDNGLINGAAADGNTQIQFFGSKSLFFNEGVSTRMTLNATGLGVGGSPTSKLSIFAGADGDVGFFRGGSTRQLQIGTSATAGYLNADNGSAGFELRVNGTARAYFDTSGNVGIGVVPSAWVAGAKALQFGAYGALAQSSSGNIELSFNSYNSGAGAYKYLQNDTASLYRASSVHSWFTATSGLAGTAITDFATAKMTLDASGRLLVGPTSANASGGVLQLSSGITFPATQVASSDANTLDDYEEGTWTPTFTFATPGTLSINYGNRNGNYTKVGNLVTARFGITINPAQFSKGTASGALIIGGLPFNIGSTGAYYFDLAASLADQSAGSLVLANPVGGTNQIYLESVSVSGTRILRDYAAITAANFAATNAGFITIAAVIQYTV